jgi:hypothetical protein
MPAIRFRPLRKQLANEFPIGTNTHIGHRCVHVPMRTVWQAAAGAPHSGGQPRAMPGLPGNPNRGSSGGDSYTDEFTGGTAAPR